MTTTIIVNTKQDRVYQGQIPPYTIQLNRAIKFECDSKTTTFRDIILLTDSLSNLKVSLQYTFTFPGTYTDISSLVEPDAMNVSTSVNESIITLFFTQNVNGSNIPQKLIINNNDIINSLEKCLDTTNLIISFSLDSFQDSNNCGPKIQALIIGDKVKVSVEDIGYAYSYDGKLTVESLSSCDIVTSELFLPLPIKSCNIETYILSLFVYGYLKCVSNLEDFRRRLLLTPFRSFQLA